MRRLASRLLLTATLAACAHTPARITIATDAPATVARHLTVLYIADLHGQLETHPELFWGADGDRVEEAGGLARLATAVRRVRAERGAENVLLLDAGDTIQGSAAAAHTQGAAVIAPLNLLGLDAGVPGNWEVAYGVAAMRERVAEMSHPLVATNVTDATGAPAFAPFVSLKRAGVTVAVVGYTDPDVPERQPPAYSAGLTYHGPETLQPAIDAARRAGAEVVLLLSHIGLSKAVALTGSLTGVDAHLSGDTHERTYEPLSVGDVWVVEPGAFGSFIGRLDLTVVDGRVIDRRWTLMEITAREYPEAPDVAAVVARTLAPLRHRLDAVVGHTHTRLERYNVMETTLDAVLADALREAAGTDIALSNGFRFSPPVQPGPIRERHLWDFYPVVTRLKTGTVTGHQLRAFWERELENVFAEDPTRRFGGWLPRPSGMAVEVDLTRPRGERVVSLTVGGEPVRPDASYTLVACEREGDPEDRLCRIGGVQDARVLELDAHDAVRRYLQKHPDVRQALEGRVRDARLTAPMRSQVKELQR